MIFTQHQEIKLKFEIIILNEDIWFQYADLTQFKVQKM